VSQVRSASRERAKLAGQPSALGAERQVQMLGHHVVAELVDVAHHGRERL